MRGQGHTRTPIQRLEGQQDGQELPGLARVREAQVEWPPWCGAGCVRCLGTLHVERLVWGEVALEADLGWEDSASDSRA